MKPLKWFVCDACGTGVSVDEDECCVTCGGATGLRAIPAAALRSDVVALRIQVAALKAEVRRLRRLASREHDRRMQ